MKNSLIFILELALILFLLTSCAGEIVPEEERITINFSYESVTGFDYYDEYSDGVETWDVGGEVDVGINQITVDLDSEEETFDEEYDIDSVRKSEQDGRDVYTYYFEEGEFKMYIENDNEVYLANISLHNREHLNFNGITQ